MSCLQSNTKPKRKHNVREVPLSEGGGWPERTQRLKLSVSPLNKQAEFFALSQAVQHRDNKAVRSPENMSRLKEEARAAIFLALGRVLDFAQPSLSMGWRREHSKLV